MRTRRAAGQHPIRREGLVADADGEFPEKSGEESVFTRFVAALAAGGEPESGLVQEMTSKLVGLLRRELGRRRLSHTSPVWLGIYGYSGWWPGREGPFEELFQAAYGHVFVERLGVLVGQVAAGRAVDGLVVACIRQFLHDGQAHQDRLGSRLYAVLASAVRRGLENGDLTIVSGSPRVRPATVLAVGQEQQPVAPPEQLVAVARRINDDFLPDLVTALRADRRRLEEALARRLGELDLEGISAFRFGDLVSPLQSDVRGRWSALLAPPGTVEDLGEDDRVFAPFACLENSFADRLEAQNWTDRMLDCIEGAVDSLTSSEGTRGYLRRIVGFFRVSLSPAATPPEAPGLDLEEKRPSDRRLADHLKIPRERLPGLVLLLQRFFEHCRKVLAAGPAKREETRR